MIASRYNATYDVFEYASLPDGNTSQNISEWLSGSESPIRIVSKDLPVIHTKEDDSLPVNLSPFQSCDVYKDEWKSNGICCYFGIAPFVTEIRNSVLHAVIRHFSTVLHQFWLDTEQVFHVDFEQNYMHFYCKKDWKFLFYNKLYFENEADVHYNLALVQKEIFDNAENPRIVFSGEIDKNSRIWKTLKSYYSDIIFINEHSSDFLMNDKPVNPLYFDKFAALSCE